MTIEKYLQQHYLPGTAKEYQKQIELYRSNFKQADQAAYKDITGYIGILRQHYKTSTLQKMVSCIKLYYEYLCHAGIRSDNPAKAIKLRDKINKDVQLQDLFTLKELENLLNRKESHKELGCRNKVLMGLLIYQGLRPKEIETLSLQDINLHTGNIFIKATGKTNSRELPLKPNQVLLIYQYIHEVRVKLLQNKVTDKLIVSHRGKAYTTTQVTGFVTRVFKNAYANRKVNPQTIRQSVIANLFKQGHDISVVQSFAGHKLPGATQRYKQNSVDTLKTAIQKYHPLQ